MVTLLVIAGLALAACGKPKGTDGDLTNHWAAMPSPTFTVPTAGSCYDVATDDPSAVGRWPKPVDCTAAHTVETAYVGAFTGADETRELPPPSGTDARRNAYLSCAGRADALLGGDWRGGRLDLFLVLPPASLWQAGARWYRCDLVEYHDLDTYQVVSRTTSLAGGLATVGLSCLTVTQQGAHIDKLLPVGCDQPHNGEFAGIYEQPDGAYPGDDDAAKQARLAGCKAVVAKYAAIPNDADLQARIGWISYPFTELDWSLGNRGVRCYAHADTPMTGSIRNGGPRKLPID